EERQTWTVAYFPDGKRLASIAHLDRCIRLWELGGGKELRVIRTRHQNGPQCLAVSPDGRTLATGGEFDHTVCLWDPADGKLLRQWQAHEGGRGPDRGVWGRPFSTDGKPLPSAGAEETVRLWDPANGRQRMQLEGRGGCLAFSPDGRTLACSAADSSLRLWEALTGRQRHRFAGHEGYVMGLAFSADGRRLLSGGAGAPALVWDGGGAGPGPRRRAGDALARRGGYLVERPGQ